jgi:hypothetical protein
MARPKSKIPLVLKPIRLFEGDFEIIQSLFPTLGGGVAIRYLVRNYIKQIQSHAAPLDIELPEATVEEILNDK